MLSLVRGHYTVFVYGIMQWWVWGAIPVTENSHKLTFSCFIKSCYHPWILQNLWAINHLISSVQYSSCFYFFKIYFWIIRVYECLCTHKCSVPMEFKGGHQVFSTWNYRLWEPSTGNWTRLSSRAIPCLNCWITDLTLKWLLCGYFYNGEDNEAYKVSIKKLFPNLINSFMCVLVDFSL